MINHTHTKILLNAPRTLWTPEFHQRIRQGLSTGTRGAAGGLASLSASRPTLAC